jgi:hypothetical protein
MDSGRLLGNAMTTMAANNSLRTAKRGPGRRFAKGRSGNPKGRPRGRRNRATLDAKAFATAILEDPAVQARMLADARRGKLAPAIVVMLFQYAYGKPKESVEITLPETLHVIVTDSIGEDPTSPPTTPADGAQAATSVPPAGRAA